MKMNKKGVINEENERWKKVTKFNKINKKEV